MAGGDFMFYFIKIIIGLFFDSADAVIGNFISMNVRYGYPDICCDNCWFYGCVFLMLWIFSGKTEIW